MSKQQVVKNPAGGDEQSIKEAIQSLAHQLWLQKHHWIGGVDWLVDGRLRNELDELSRSELVRIKRRLLRNVVQMPAEARHLSARPA